MSVFCGKAWDFYTQSYIELHISQNFFFFIFCAVIFAYTAAHPIENAHISHIYFFKDFKFILLVFLCFVFLLCLFFPHLLLIIGLLCFCICICFSFFFCYAWYFLLKTFHLLHLVGYALFFSSSSSWKIFMCMYIYSVVYIRTCYINLNVWTKLNNLNLCCSFFFVFYYFVFIFHIFYIYIPHIYIYIYMIYISSLDLHAHTWNNNERVFKRFACQITNYNMIIYTHISIWYMEKPLADKKPINNIPLGSCLALPPYTHTQSWSSWRTNCQLKIF